MTCVSLEHAAQLLDGFQAIIALNGSRKKKRLSLFDRAGTAARATAHRASAVVSRPAAGAGGRSSSADSAEDAETGLAALCPAWFHRTSGGPTRRLSVTELVASRRPVKKRKKRLSVDDAHKRAHSRRHLESLHSLVHLYDEARTPHGAASRRVPLEAGTECEVLWHANASIAASVATREAAIAELGNTFTPGTYCRGSIVAYDEARDAYAVAYESGPFDMDDADLVDAEATEAILGSHLLFKHVARAHVLRDARDAPASTWPVFITCVTCVDLAVFFAYVISGSRDGAVGWSHPTGGPESVWLMVVEPAGNTASPCTDLRWQLPYRLLTYGFVHSGLQHLVFNGVVQCAFGIPIEMVHGTGTVAALYGAGVVFGGLVAAAADPYDSLVGASGGVYGLMGVHAGNLFINWRRMHGTRWKRLFVYVTMLSLDLGSWINAAETAATSHAAHAGGYIGGALLAILVTPGAGRRVKIVRPFALVAYVAAWVVALALVCRPPPWSSLEAKAPCCAQLQSCDRVAPRDYGAFSCAGGWKVNWAGFSEAHGGDETASCAEMAAYVASRD